MFGENDVNTDHQHDDAHGSTKQMAIVLSIFFAVAYASVTVIMYHEYPPVRARMDAYFADKVATLYAALH